MSTTVSLLHAKNYTDDAFNKWNYIAVYTDQAAILVILDGDFRSR